MNKKKLVYECAAFLVLLGIVVFLLLPLLFGACSSLDAKRINNRWKLEDIYGAMRFYAEEHEGRLPPHRLGDQPDENGIYPHSWRVYLLPYLLTEVELASFDIRLTEPWDSEWNRQFHERCPAEFGDYMPQGIYGATFCLVVGGEIPADGPGVDFQKIKQYPTVMLAKSQPGCWMDPNHDILAAEAVAGLNQSKHGIHVDEKETAWPAVLTDGTFREFPVKESSAENLRIWLGVDK